ncbi:MAG: putative threonine dehydratase, partial [Chloroflexi bacterium]|nr:putative threonine dehydratase [Chloroflexota bacterium]
MGLEFCSQAPDLEAVIVPVGGGGLCAGIATAVKQILPGCLVFGVEPEGADTMHRSFASGQPESITKVNTIADSLGSPRAEPYSFELCRQNLDGLAMVNDDELRKAMYLMFRGMRLAVEPAGAAALAALCGPLK